ncbi:LuxR C-terminal-related transcriptional regulator [Gordonia sp. CPCC 205515]|uniref:helix-turn-helix transcriptional regulator n=1 Tax=Gordonia sp. CPCC 205515 TaxID=3140791 RepID=UPI003AF3E987
MPLSWPLVERRADFDAIKSTLGSGTPPCCGTVLTGPAGVGKTTLARQVVAPLDGVRWVVGTESARAIPLGAFANVVAPAAARDTIGVLSSARESLLSEESLVLCVDDAHLLDPLSATLLHQLAIDRDARIVATVRSGETLPDAVTSLWKDGYLKRLELSPFTQEESVELLERALGGHVEGLSAELMWEASGGNALFLRHLVDGAVEAGNLRERNGIWQLRGNTSVTSEFATLLGDRLVDLPDEVTNVLDLVALCEPVELDLLCDLAGETAVDDAEERELIRISRGGNRFTVQFMHPLLGDVIRRRLGRVRARRLRGRLVSAMLDRRIDTNHDRMRLADLALESDQDIGVGALTDAARVAIGLSDVAAGERFARAAFDQQPTIDSADALARALLWQGRPDDVESVLISLSPDGLDELGLLRWGATRMSNFLFSQGDQQRSDEMMQMLRERITLPILVSVVEAVDAVRALLANDITGAADRARAVIDDPEAPPTAKFWGAFGAQRALALMGRSDEVAGIAADMQMPSSVDGLLWYSAAFGEVQANVYAGRFDIADDCVARCAQFSSPGQYLAWAMTQTLRGFTAVYRGRLDEAVVVLQEATAAITTDSLAAWRFPSRMLLAVTYALLGQADQAREVAAVTRSAMQPVVAVFDPTLRIAEGWIAAAEGVRSDAVAAFGKAAASARESSQWAVEMEALHALARIGDASGAPRLAELATMIDGVLAPLYARHAVAVAEKDGVELEKCATELETIGALVSAADSAAQAASAYAADDDRTSASRAGVLAHRLAALCGGLVTPALIDADDPLPLTTREREIANLVAAGLSNREIADRLTVSVRTVEGHIYRACTKLNVTDRTELGLLIVRAA